jgi:NAD(P)-dependent dehydrogenase (short-subunit alcohol dehydrogenase family)
MNLNVNDPEAIRAFADRVTAEHPGLNVLINNAGIMKAENLKTLPAGLGESEAVITTNLLGPIRLTAALLPHLRRQTHATIVNVSSGLAFVPLPVTPTKRSIPRFNYTVGLFLCLLRFHPVADLPPVRKQKLSHRPYHVAAVGEEFEIGIILVQRGIAELL